MTAFYDASLDFGYTQSIWKSGIDSQKMHQILPAIQIVLSQILVH
jgi:hypothetical protein